jgi:hypothetical protein
MFIGFDNLHFWYWDLFVAYYFIHFPMGFKYLDKKVFIK